MLNELARRGALHQRPAHAAGEMYALTLDVGPGRLPDRDRFGVVAEIDAGLLENGIGVVLEQRESFLAQYFVVGNLACDVGYRRSGTRGPGCPLRIATAGAPRMTGRPRVAGWRVLLVHSRSPETDFEVWSLLVSAADQFASWTCHDAPFCRPRKAAM